MTKKQIPLSQDQIDPLTNYPSTNQQIPIQKVKTSSLFLKEYFTYLFSNKKYNQIPQFNNQTNNLSNQEQIKSQNQSQNNKNDIASQVYQLYKQFYLSQRQKLNQIILNDGTFKKCDHFTSTLIISNIQNSKYYEVVEMQIQLLSYKTTIQIINQNHQSCIHHQVQMKCFGAFGNVYFATIKHQRYAVKCLPINRKNSDLSISFQENITKFNSALKQYFFILLFSVLKIGPKVKKMYGFDILMTDDCLEFSTQICQDIVFDEKNSNELILSLRAMHFLNIVHRDIKTYNIMYSQTFRKPVFIDFGGTQVLIQTIGYKTRTNFYGTTGYTSAQVVQLIGKKSQFVDLYYNDLFGLRKTITQNFNIGNAELRNPDESISYSILQPRRTKQYTQQIIFVKIKFLLYNKLYDQFQEEFSYVHHSSQQEFQKSLLDFFIQLLPDEWLCRFYTGFMSDQILNTDEYKGLNVIYRYKQTRRQSLWYSFPEKQKLFSSIRNFYQKLQIVNNNENQFERYLQLILINKELIQNIIFSVDQQKIKNILNVNVNDYKNNIYLYCLIVLQYCSFYQNLFQATIQDKIIAAQFAINKIKQEFPQKIQSLKLFFECKIDSLLPLAQFFQFFSFQIWSHIPESFQQNAFRNVVASLILLGYPTTSQVPKLYLLNNFLTQNQTKINKILYFWQFYLLTSSYGVIYYDKTHQSFKLRISQSQFNQMVKNQTEVNSPYQINPQQDKQKQGQNKIQKQRNIFNGVQKIIEKEKNKNLKDQQLPYINIFFKLNSQFYQKAFVNFKQLSIRDAEYFIDSFKLILHKNWMAYSFKIKKWKQYVTLILVLVSNIAFLHSLKINSFMQSIDYRQKQVSSLSLFTPLQFNLKEIHFSQQSQWFLKIFDKIVNYQPLSIRYMLHCRLQLSLLHREPFYLSKIMQVINQIKRASQSNMQYLQMLINSFSQCVSLQIQQLGSYSSKSQLDIFCFNDVLKNTLNILVDICENFIGKDHKIKDKKSPTNSRMTYESCIQNYIYFVLKMANTTQLLISKILKYLRVLRKQNSLKSFCQQRMNKILYQQKQNQLTELSRVMTQLSSKLYGRIQINNYIADNQLSRIKFTQIQIHSLSFGIDTDLKVKQLIEQQFGILTLQELQKNGLKYVPLVGLMLTYIVSSIQVQNHQNSYYELLIQLYKLCQDNQAVSLWQNNYRLCYLFNAFVYCKKDFSYYEDFFTFITDSIKKHPSKEYIRMFQYTFHNRFWSIDQPCFPKSPPSNWIPINLIEYLTSRMNLQKAKQNCYMSFVYYFCLMNKKISLKIQFKLLQYVRRTLKYLNFYGKIVILKNLYTVKYSVQTLMQAQGMKSKRKIYQKQKQKQKNMQSLNILNKNIKTFKIADLASKRYYRRSVFLLQRHLRNQQPQQYLQQLVEQHFLLRQNNNKNWNLPLKFKQFIRKKYRNYHIVKENYKFNDQSQQIFQLFGREGYTS